MQESSKKNCFGIEKKVFPAFLFPTCCKGKILTIAVENLLGPSKMGYCLFAVCCVTFSPAYLSNSEMVITESLFWSASPCKPFIK